MIKKNKKGQLNISFGWIFAIIIGAAILFLAIFAITKFTNLQQTQRSAETGKTLSVLLNPLETGYETGTKVTISASTETRINTSCDPLGTFGKQKIETYEKSFDKWSASGVNIVYYNRYIFSKSSVEGRNFYAFSKPFEFEPENSYDFPFKVADVIYIISSDDKYCFDDAPARIKKEISDLKMGNFVFENCTQSQVKVCFSVGNDCDIEVNENAGVVKKNSAEVNFEGDALMYAAIFSGNKTYECQVGRLMKRAGEIANIYSEKSNVIETQGCDGELETDLISFGSLLENYESSKDIFIIKNRADDLNKKNGNAGRCKLW